MKPSWERNFWVKIFINPWKSKWQKDHHLWGSSNRNILHWGMPFSHRELGNNLENLQDSWNEAPCHGYESREQLLRKVGFSQKAAWKIGRELTGCSFHEPSPVGELSGGVCFLVHSSCGVTHSLAHHTRLAWCCLLGQLLLLHLEWRFICSHALRKSHSTNN